MSQPDQHTPVPRDITIFWRLLRLVAPFRGWMALAALLGFLTVGSSIGLMSAAAWIIARAALHPSIAVLNVAIVGVRFFGIARGVLRYLERIVSHQTTFRLLARLRVWFYEALEPLAPARLVQFRSGDLLARIVDDIDTLENVYLRVIAPPVVAVMVGLLMAVFFGVYDGRLAGTLLGFLAMAGVGVPLLTHWLARRTGRELVTIRSTLTVALLDGVQGLPDLIAYGAQETHRAQIDRLSAELAHRQRRMSRIAALNTALGSLLISLAVVAVLWIAVPLVHGGSLDGVMLAVLALATITSFEAVLPLPAAIQHLEGSLMAARRLFEIVDAAPAAAAPENPLPCPAQIPDLAESPLLAVSNVRFRYTPADPPALDGISFELRQGHTLAIVGPSGAGKSTLIHLLLRFWDYEAGQIRLAGREVRACDPEDVRACFAVVSQRTDLFNATIRENLRLARPDANETDLIAAAQAAHLHEFIAALPSGYDTWIGEQGQRLSGGQRQRLAIARAVLKDAPILILDEATTNLDALTARAIMETIHSALAHRTRVIVTHWLAGLETADRILVLHAGRIVEQGQHIDLVRAGGLYHRLWTSQRNIDTFPIER